LTAPFNYDILSIVVYLVLEDGLGSEETEGKSVSSILIDYLFS